jgi:5-methylcytosine-specific restriction endonuclease McrA
MIDSKKKADVWSKTGGKCFYCGSQTIPFGSFKASFSVDHLWPRIRGGGDNIENLVPSCHRCNSQKNDTNLNEWLVEKPFGAGAWAIEELGLDWSEAKKDPQYISIEDYMERA